MKERLTDGDVIVVEVFREPLLGHGLLVVFDVSLCDEGRWAHNLWTSCSCPEGPISSAAVRVVVNHDIKEDEGKATGRASSRWER